MQIEIDLPEDTWEMMKNCSKEEYKSDDRPDKCDYQEARCTFMNIKSGYNVTNTCKVRRKGSTTWRDIDKKPSFKIKKFETESEEDVEFGEFDCNYCPPNKTKNVWKTNKITMNNQVSFDGEIDAYKLFREVVASPLAQKAILKLYRNGTLHSEQEYAMVETIDDRNFVEKWFGPNYVLYEKEGNYEFERFGQQNKFISDQFLNTSQCATDKCVEKETEKLFESSAHLSSLLNISFDDYNLQNLVNYYAGEVSTNHWDGACFRHNHPFGDYLSQFGSGEYNSYMVYNGNEYFYIPSGVDNTFQCPLNATNTQPTCTPMQQCFQDETCKAEYESSQAIVDSHMTRFPMAHCFGIRQFGVNTNPTPNWVWAIISGTFIPLGITGLCLMRLRIQKYRL